MNRHQFPDRRTIRLQEFDYSKDGIYFVTIDTYEKRLLFGNVHNCEMMLNDLGRIAQDCWRSIPDHFRNAGLNEYIVMSNHLHGLVVLLGKEEADTACRVPTTDNLKQEAFSKPTTGSIPTIIRSFKSAVTKLIHERYPSQMDTIWQSRYYERVIRNEKELIAAINYLRDNPIKWHAQYSTVPKKAAI